jgi:Mitochondrial ribosomal subunit protein
VRRLNSHTETPIKLKFVSSRNPLSRIVTIVVKFATLNLDKHARDKFLRLVGERYNAETDELTITADRCPLRKQNLDYATYLLTGKSRTKIFSLFHT